jgi:hypothetical protein
MLSLGSDGCELPLPACSISDMLGQVEESNMLSMPTDPRNPAASDRCIIGASLEA